MAIAIGLVTAAAEVANAHGDREHGRENFAAGEPGDPARPAKAVAVTLEEMSDGTMVKADRSDC